MDNGMTLGEAIRERRSIGLVKNDPVEPEKINKMLEAGNWAPNHYRTWPWRFYVMTGEGRKVLADAYADIAAEHKGDAAPPELEELRSKQAAKAYRAPVVIAAAVSPSTAKGVVRAEEFAAVHAAIQNMLLTAHALGLGAIWRTGEPAYHPRMKQAFQLNDEEELAALLYVGYPAMEPPAVKRKPVEENTVWITG